MNKTILSILIVALVASFCAIYFISPCSHEISSLQLVEEALVEVAQEDLWDNAAYQTIWEAYKEEFHKVYKTEEKEKKAFENWLENKKKIKSSSSDSQTWVQGDSIFSDLSDQEFKATYLNLQIKNSAVRGASDASLLPVAPASVDWVAAQKVTPVKDQGSCGSCWAFATVGALESLSSIRDRKSQLLSEQQFLDCTYGLSSLSGCSGGWPSAAMEWSKTNGNTLNSSYPYNAKNNGKTKCPALVSSMKSYGAGAVAQGNVDDLA